MNKHEIAIANLSELKNGEMKEVTAGETKILLARVEDKCYAVGANCPHYGAPLVDGILHGDRIVCPWHHACYNARTGDFEEPPAFDSLPSFAIRIEGDQIFVNIPDNSPDRRTPAMVRRNDQDERVFVILGGGAAGFMAAQTLREDGFTGRLIMITREDRLPYDRPNLSKDYLQGHAEPEWMPLRPEEFFSENDIEVWFKKEVTKVKTAAKLIIFAGGSETLKYDSLLIATGGAPRKLPFQSEAQENVYLLRSFADTDAIIKAAGKGKRVIVIGSSFIGMEAASSLKTLGCDVTVVAPDRVPFEKILGTEIGELFQHTHEQNGVRFKLGIGVKGFDGAEKVTAVILENGERLETDFVVVGIGVKPATNFLEEVELHKDGGVITDNYLCVTENLYAAGDIAHFPDSQTNELTRIEHWRTALQQGRIAAHNMAGKHEPFSAVPFFWTTQFDATLNYVGHVKDWDQIIFQGNVENRDFLAFYVKNHRILAVAGMNRDRELDSWEEMFRNKQVPSPEQL